MDATWHFNIIIDNDEYLNDWANNLTAQCERAEFPRSALSDSLREMAEELIEQDAPGILSTSSLASEALGWFLSSVDWHTIAKDRLEELAEQE